MSNQYKQNESRKDRERDYFAKKVMAKKAANPVGDWRMAIKPQDVPGTLRGPIQSPSTHTPDPRQHVSAPSTEKKSFPSPWISGVDMFGRPQSRASHLLGPYSSLPPEHPAMQKPESPRHLFPWEQRREEPKSAARTGIPSWRDVNYEPASSGDVHHSGVGRSELDPSVHVTRVAPREEQKGYKPTYKGNYTPEPWHRRNEERISRSQTIKNLLSEASGISE